MTYHTRVCGERSLANGDARFWCTRVMAHIVSLAANPGHRFEGTWVWDRFSVAPLCRKLCMLRPFQEWTDSWESLRVLSEVPRPSSVPRLNLTGLMGSSASDRNAQPCMQHCHHLSWITSNKLARAASIRESPRPQASKSGLPLSFDNISRRHARGGVTKGVIGKRRFLHVLAHFCVNLGFLQANLTGDHAQKCKNMHKCTKASNFAQARAHMSHALQLKGGKDPHSQDIALTN